MTITLGLMPPGLPVWFQYLQGGAIIVLTIAGAFIAFRQWRTAHQKLRLDLFEKRWQVFDDTDRFCRNVMRDFAPSPEEFRLSWATRHRAQFLFGKEVNDLLKALHHDAARMRAVKDSLPSYSTPDQREAAVRAQNEAIKQFVYAYENLPDRFEHYLTFKFK